MKLSIITPTVLRPSWLKCCESVDQQTYKDWEHIVVFDGEPFAVLGNYHPNRQIRSTGKVYRNGGNTPRHQAWTIAEGTWIYYLDDDNYLASPYVLEELASYLEGVEEKWALFPIHRHGSIFYYDPPAPCYFDTGNAVVRREIAQWPNIDDYASDAVWLIQNLLPHPYKAFPNANPIMVMPKTSFGEGGGINGQPSAHSHTQ